jgi:hypothetical protein
VQITIVELVEGVISGFRIFIQVIQHLGMERIKNFIESERKLIESREVGDSHSQRRPWEDLRAKTGV